MVFVYLLTFLTHKNQPCHVGKKDRIHESLNSRPLAPQENDKRESLLEICGDFQVEIKLYTV